jgi:hypothetical protein
MMLVERIAMTKRRFRHCMSRSAAISMSARLPTPYHSRAQFGYELSLATAPTSVAERGRSSGLRLATNVFGPREHSTTSSTQFAPGLG